MELTPDTIARRIVIGLLACSALCWGSAFGQAAPYPSKPIKLVVPYGAGGGTDQIARLVADKLRVRLGQPIIVDNKPGVGTVIGSDYAARQPADGYTLLLTTSGLTSAPSMMAKLPFDPVKDFTPIAPLAIMLISLSANNAVPASNVPELVAYMKANPGKVNYASYGVATTNNLAMALFNQRAGVISTHVPYKAGAQALPDLVSGQVQLIFDSMQTSGPLIKAGKLKALAIASSRRSPLAPGLPTVAEAGLPGFEFEPWFGILGPAGMPREIVERLNREITSIVHEADVQETMRLQYLTPLPGSPEQMRDIVRKDVAYWAAAAQAAGVKPE
jgi:tripartite-type tricarboxylate transporter receptor subunit TctC